MTLELAIIVFLISVLFFAAWRLESGLRIVVTPFLLAMYFELFRVLPAFVLADRFLPIQDTYALWVAFAAFASLIGGFVFFYCYPVARPDRVLAFSERRTELERSPFDALAVLGLAILLTVAGLIYFGGLPATVQSAFSLVTAGGNEELARLVDQQRLEMTKGAYFGGEYRGQGIFSTVQEIGWMLICVYAVLNHLRTRTMISLSLVLLAVAAAWILVGGLGSRAPFLNIFICMLAAYSLRRPLSVRAAALAVGLALLLAILLSLYSSKMFALLSGSTSAGDFLSQAMLKIAERAFIGNGINDVRAIEFTRTGELEHGLGAVHLRDLISSIPGIQYGQPLAYKLYLLSEGREGTTFFSATYLADVWVDFAWPGVFVLYFAIGMAVGATQRWMFTLPPRPWTLAFAILIAFYVMNVLRGGPTSLLPNLLVLGGLWTLHLTIRTALLLLARIARPAVVRHA